MGEVLLIDANTLPELQYLTLLLLTVPEVAPSFLCDIQIRFHIGNALNCLICRSDPCTPPCVPSSLRKTLMKTGSKINP